MGQPVKRSPEPVFWALFGAGGMLSALLAPALIAVTGVLAPLGVFGDLLARERVLALLQSPAAALAVLGVVALFVWHACHRLLHSAHDLGARPGAAGRWIAYGFAAACTVATAALLLALRG
jgi:fumarate reductase subunit D